MKYIKLFEDYVGDNKSKIDYINTNIKPFLDLKKEYILNDETGRFVIHYGEVTMNNILKYRGYDNLQELIDEDMYFDYIKDIVKEYQNKKRNYVQIISWFAKEIGSGFGRKVLNKVYSLCKELGINDFHINNQSPDARSILKHYVDTNKLLPNLDSKAGSSFEDYYHIYSFTDNYFDGEMKKVTESVEQPKETYLEKLKNSNFINTSLNNFFNSFNYDVEKIDKISKKYY